MVTRRTKADILDLERRINAVLERHGSEAQVTVQWAYGQPRAHIQQANEPGIRDLSPRLPTGAMYEWLYAYLQGLVAGVDLGQASARLEALIAKVQAGGYTPSTQEAHMLHEYDAQRWQEAVRKYEEQSAKD